MAGSGARRNHRKRSRPKRDRLDSCPKPNRLERLRCSRLEHRPLERKSPKLGRLERPKRSRLGRRDPKRSCRERGRLERRGLEPGFERLASKTWRGSAADCDRAGAAYGGALGAESFQVVSYPQALK